MKVGYGDPQNPISASLLGASPGSGAGLINAGSSLPTAISTCGSTPSIIQITQGITVSTAVNVPTKCTLRFDTGGELLPGSGGSVTSASGMQIQAPTNQQIFGTGLSVSGLTGSSGSALSVTAPHPVVAVTTLHRSRRR